MDGGAQLQASESGGRKYRSKKQRPCDLCRTRKIQCKLRSETPDCELCQRLDRQCTFVLGPLRRRRPQADDEGASAHAAQTIGNAHRALDNMEVIMADSQGDKDVSSSMNTDLDAGGAFWLHQEGLNQAFSYQDASGQLDNWNELVSPFNAVTQEMESSNLTNQRGPGFDAYATLPFPHSEHHDRTTAPESQSTPATMATTSTTSPSSNRRSSASDWPSEFSLEAKKGYSNHLIGLSCETDPFLLRQYRYNSHENHHMFRLDFRNLNGCRTNQPLQFMMSDESIWQDDVKFVEKSLSGHEGSEAADAVVLKQVVSPDIGARLIKLYTRFVHPRYPVLSVADLNRISSSESDMTLAAPIGIKSAVYALAAPFTFLDDELSVSKGYWEVPTQELWAIAHRSFQRASCLSHLSLLQLCLLLLHMPPQNWVVAEPTKFWSLSCSAVAIAENLGLNLDPTDWRIPHAEVIVRRKLWWFTYMAHTSHALVCGRPSHIHDEDWHVSRLTREDFEDGEGLLDAEVRASIEQQIPILLSQYDLSLITAEVLKEFYSVKARSESNSLATLLARAQPLRARIESWRQTLPILSTSASELSEDDLEEGAVLRLSHLTLEIMIFRALLRPLSYDASLAAERCQEPVSTIFKNCYVCASVATDMISSLKAKNFARFWPHCKH